MCCKSLSEAGEGGNVQSVLFTVSPPALADVSPADTYNPAGALLPGAKALQGRRTKGLWDNE